MILDIASYPIEFFDMCKSDNFENTLLYPEMQEILPGINHLSHFNGGK